MEAQWHWLKRSLGVVENHRGFPRKKRPLVSAKCTTDFTAQCKRPSCPTANHSNAPHFFVTSTILSTIFLFSPCTRSPIPYQHTAAMPSSAAMILKISATIPLAVKPSDSGVGLTGAPSRLRRSSVLPAAFPWVWNLG